MVGSRSNSSSISSLSNLLSCFISTVPTLLLGIASGILPQHVHLRLSSFLFYPLKIIIMMHFQAVEFKMKIVVFFLLLL